MYADKILQVLFTLICLCEGSFNVKSYMCIWFVFLKIQFDDNVYQARRNAHRAIEMCVHMSPGTEGVVDAKLVPVLVGKLLKEEDEIKVCTYVHDCM